MNTCRKWKSKDDYISHINFVSSIPETVRFSVTQTNHTLNPNAKVFYTRTMPAKYTCVTNIITAVLMTLLFLLLFLMMIIYSNNGNAAMNPKETFRKLKNDNPNKISIGHLNINSIRNKIEFLKELIGVNVDIFLISEIKLNDTFPTGQFLINGYQLPLRFDRNGNGGGLLLYCRDHIPCKKLNLDFNPVIEVIATEINLKKSKWLLIGSYNP